MAENGEYNASPVRFDIFTREWNDDRREWIPSALKAVRDPDGKMRLSGIASSTIKDRHGDTILLSALEDMERAANSGLTIFGNHSYEVPEDVYGQVESAAIKQAGTVDGNGDPIYDLRFSIVMNEENERAVKTWRAIEKGSKLGISIGAMIPEGGAVRDKKSGTFTIAHLELLETSIVGIPANPRSWVENAIKSMTAPTQKATSTIPVGQPSLTLDTDAGTYTIEGRLDGINLGIGDVETNTYNSETVEVALSEDESNGGGSQTDSTLLDVTPDVTDAKVRVIEIDTGDDEGSGGSSSQGASSSEPAPTPESVDGEDGEEPGDVLASASEVIEEAETVIASLDPEITSTFQQLLSLTEGLTRELAASIEREEQARAEKAAAERQRDEVVVVAGKIISNASAIINKLADLPVGRRTKFVDTKSQFEELEGIYTRDFLTLLRSKNT
jgi:phage head maturation protease